MKKLLINYLRSRGFFILSPEQRKSALDIAVEMNKKIVSEKLDINIPYQAGKLDGYSNILSAMNYETDQDTFVDRYRLILETEIRKSHSN